MTNTDYQKLYNKLDKYVKEHVNEKRYIHTLGVVAAAEKYALKYGADINKARIAAIFHDACKNDVGGLEHGEAAARLIQEKFGVDDIEIVESIKNHTIGRPNMCLLEKVMKLADLLEEGRTYEDAPLIRAYDDEYNDIDKTYLKLIERQKEILVGRGIAYDKRTDEVIEYLRKVIDNDK